jgi:hypothetical protein
VLDPGGGVVPYRTRLSDDSSVCQVTRAEFPVTLLTCTLEMDGAVQSTPAVVLRGTLVPPAPSSASM